MKVFKSLRQVITLRTVAYMLVLITVMYAFTSREVSEAILDFCFGGIVPGTDHVLSPNAMIVGALAGLVVLVMGILSSWLLRVVAVAQAMKRLGIRMPVILENDNAVQHDIPAHEPAVTPVTPVPARFKRFPDAMLLVRHYCNAVVSAIGGARLGRVARQAVQKVLRAVYYTSGALRVLTIRTVRLLASIVFVCVALTAIAVDWFWVHARSFAKRVWRWLLPRTVQFDIWLEMQYRSLTRWIQKRLDRSETYQVLLAIYRHGK